MKHFYSIFLLFAAVSLTAQTAISFEEDEGYEIGNLHNQNGWEVTEGSDGIIENQMVTNEMASDGFLSFKNAYEPDFDFQLFPIFGAAMDFDTPKDYTDFNISYDVLVTDTMGADFEFVAYTVTDDIFVPVAGVGMEFQGGIYIIKDEDYGFQMLSAEWEPNTWVNIRVEVDDQEIKYFVNDELEYTLANYTQQDIHGFNMLHNNYGNDAYYDNIQINSEALGVEDQELPQVKLYPNPTSDVVRVQLPNNQEVQKIIVYNLMGKKIITQNTNKIDLSQYPSGAYLVEIITKSGETQTRKVIKK